MSENVYFDYDDKVFFENVCEDNYINSDISFAVHRQLKINPKPTKDELSLIMENYHRGDESLRKKAQEEMLGVLDSYLIYIISTQYAAYMKDYMEELMAHGYMGILLGMKTYDPSKGKPTTWFTRYIKHEIQVYINTQITHTTQYYHAITKKILSCINRKKKYNISYTVEDISGETGISPRTIEKCLRNKQNVLPAYVMEQVQNKLPEYEDPELYIERRSEKEAIDALIYGEIVNYPVPSILTAKEQKIIILRFGFDGNGMRNYTQIANITGLSKYIIIKILKTALEKIKKYLRL